MGTFGFEKRFYQYIFSVYGAPGKSWHLYMVTSSHGVASNEKEFCIVS